MLQQKDLHDDVTQEIDHRESNCRPPRPPTCAQGDARYHELAGPRGSGLAGERL